MKMVTVLKKRDKVTSQATDRGKELGGLFSPLKAGGPMPARNHG